MAALVTTINVQDSTKNINYPSGSISITTGDGEQSGVLNTVASPTEASITIDSQITGGNGPGLMLLRNLSTTAAETIDFGTATTVYNITLNANDGVEMNWVAVPLKSTVTTIYYASASGSPKFWYKIFERGA